MSETAICNRALMRLGDTYLTSLDDDSGNAARLCRAFYAPTRDALLRSYPWTFATRRASLTQEASTPAFGYDYQYLLPPDYLRAISVNEMPDGWAIEGGKLLSDESTISLRYIAKVTGVEDFDPLFSELLSLRLAENLAFPLTKSATMVQAMMSLADAKEVEAYSADSVEGPGDEAMSSDYLIEVR